MSQFLPSGAGVTGRPALKCIERHLGVDAAMQPPPQAAPAVPAVAATSLQASSHGGSVGGSIAGSEGGYAVASRLTACIAPGVVGAAGAQPVGSGFRRKGRSTGAAPQQQIIIASNRRALKRLPAVQSR